MLKIDMDNGKRYVFDNYDEYFCNTRFCVVSKNDEWIGCFLLDHMVGFFAESEQEKEHNK